jgi:hypothetical protein
MPPTPVRHPSGSTIDLDYWPLHLPDGVGRHGWRTPSAHGTSSTQGNAWRPSPSPRSTGSAGPAPRRGRRTTTPEFLFLFYLILLFSLFPLSLLYCPGCNLPFPLNYKKGSMVSRRGQRLNNTYTLNLERLGSWSLSRPFVILTTNSSASNTNSLPLDVGTFRPNPYTSSCHLCTPSEPRRAIHKIH